MNNFEYVDNVYRSRMTLLDILEARGYDVEAFRKFSPAEISVAVEAFPSLSFQVKKKDDPAYICLVRYATVSRQKIDEFFEKIEEDAPTDMTKLEVVVMMKDAVADIHHTSALKQYMSRKLRVSFFSIFMIVNNPMKHVLVPKHEIVPQEKHKELMESLYITSKAKFPLIRFHVDPIVRCLGAVPGDIIEITRPSPSAGEYVVYRVVAP
jgi:DNA-directed RNA polymerase subunit H (RpoH/RPB5)